jgi:hypothetical protein
MKSLNWHIPLDTPLSICAYQVKILELPDHQVRKNIINDFKDKNEKLSCINNIFPIGAATYSIIVIGYIYVELGDLMVTIF